MRTIKFNRQYLIENLLILFKIRTSHLKLVASLLLIANCLFQSATAQVKTISLSEAKQLALQNNQQLISSNLEIDYQQALKKGATEIPKTDVSLLYGQTNSIEKNDNNINISQTIPFPTVFAANSALADAHIKGAQLKTEKTKNELLYQVVQAYTNLQYLMSKAKLLKQQDSIYQGFLSSASLRYKTGESNLLEKTTAENQLFEVKNQAKQNQADIAIYTSQLQILTGVKEQLNISDADLKALNFELLSDSNATRQNASLKAIQQEIEIAQSAQKLASAKSLPDVTLGYFNQSLIGTQSINGQNVYFDGSKRFQGVQLGLAIPIFYGSYRSKIKAAGINKDINEANAKLFEIKLMGAYQQAVQEYLKNNETINYLESSALPNATLILKNSQLAYQGGDMSYSEHLLNLKTVNNIRENYLMAILKLNQSVNTLAFLNGNQ